MRTSSNHQGMKRDIYTGFLLATLGLAAVASAAENALPRSLPEAQGVHSGGISEFAAALGEIDAVHSFMVMRHGQVVAEGWWAPFTPDARHTLFSLSKSFTSTAVGIAVAEGKLNLNDRAADFFKDELPAQTSPNLRSMRLRDLLRMSTGHHADDLAKFSFTSQESLTKEFLALPVAHKPGTHFLYNTPATYMCSAMVQKVTGATVLDYLETNFFGPLGIENPVWETSAQGISLGGYGLHVRTEDIVRLGQLYLQKGLWNGKRILQESWVTDATSRQTSNGSNPDSDWEQGYGFQFWRCRNNAYRGDGAFGQFCIVIPDQDAVIAITSGTGDMQRVLNVVWEKLLPAFNREALVSNPPAVLKLKQQLAALTLPVVEGAGDSPIGAQVLGRTYTINDSDSPIQSIRMEQNGSNPLLVFRVRGEDHGLSVENAVLGDHRSTHAGIA